MGWVCRLQLLLVFTSFTVSDSRLPQNGVPGPRIYIHQEQCCPVIPPGTRLHFHCFLRLAGLQWRYSTSSQRGPVLHSVGGMTYPRSWSIENTTSIVGHRPLSSNGFSALVYLRSSCLSMIVFSLLISRSLPSKGYICHTIYF
jgi:hypothetical protein